MSRSMRLNPVEMHRLRYMQPVGRPLFYRSGAVAWTARRVHHALHLRLQALPLAARAWLRMALTWSWFFITPLYWRSTMALMLAGRALPSAVS